MFARLLRDAHQHADQSFRHRLGCQRFFDEFRNPIFDSQARPQALRPRGTQLFEIGERIESLLHRPVITARGRFLAQSHKSGAQQSLQLRIFLGGQLLADLRESVLQTLARSLAIKFRQLAQPDGGLLARLGVLVSHARRIFQQHVSGGIRFAASQ